MKLTTRSRYGTKMLLDIALYGSFQPVSIKDIAIRQDLPLKYLEKLIRTLRRTGYIYSTLGMYGGYQLARPAEEILVGDLVCDLEEFDAPDKNCAQAKHELMCSIWEEASVAMYQKLNTFTLADLIQDVRFAIDKYHNYGVKQ